MKKISVLLALALLLSVLAVGCSGEKPEVIVPESSAAASENTDTAEESASPSVEPVVIRTSDYYERVAEEQADALTPFVNEATQHGIPADALFTRYLREMTYDSNDPTIQKTERTVTNDGILLRTAILHELPLKEAGLSVDASLDELIAAQYGYYEQNGTYDYTGNTDKPYYHAIGLAINGSYVKVDFVLYVNGIKIDTYSIDHNVLLIPLDSDRYLVDHPMEFKLVVLDGELPMPDYIYVGIDSNISAER